MHRQEPALLQDTVNLLSPESLCVRNRAIADCGNPLPGSVRHDNVRPINVRGRFEGWTLYDVMCASHPRIDRDEWTRIFELGRILKGGVAVGKDTRVRGGEQFSHVFPDTVEPGVNADIRIVYEDDILVAVAKPAPLPMHPSGRFNHNTMMSVLNRVYSPIRLLPVHRLDANTSGIIVLPKNVQVAQKVQLKFENTEVSKQYLVRIIGHPPCGQTVGHKFECDRPITKLAGPAGLRTIDPLGKPSLTRFELLQRQSDGTSILLAKPVTGRTNQIRIHLWCLGIPVAGDPLYLPNHKLGRIQTLPLDAPPMCLHATKLSLQHPVTQREVTFQAPAPTWLPNAVGVSS